MMIRPCLGLLLAAAFLLSLVPGSSAPAREKRTNEKRGAKKSTVDKAAIRRLVDRKLARQKEDSHFVFSTTQVFVVPGAKNKVYDVGIHMLQGRTALRDAMVEYLAAANTGASGSGNRSARRISRNWVLFGAFPNEKKAQSTWNYRIKRFADARARQKSRRSTIAARQAVENQRLAGGGRTPGGFAFASSGSGRGIRSRAVG